MRRILCLLAIVSLVFASSSAFAAAEKEWTFMVFLNADNNLDSFGVGDQNEMTKVGSNDTVNIVTLIDRYNGPATLNYIEKGKVTTLKEMGEVDMGDYKLLISFANDMIARYPAKHYALVIWNHGSGWNKNKAGAPSRGISYDDSSNNHITTQQLGAAINEIGKGIGHKLDLLCMDACLMQMMEVVWQIRDGCSFVVASEETEPGDGYPYDTILGALKPGMGARDFATQIVKAYAASYSHEDPNDGDWGRLAHHPGLRLKRTTQSAIETAKLPMLNDAINVFAKTTMAGNHTPQIKEALLKVERFSTWSNCDLAHLLKLLVASVGDAKFLAAAKNLQVALADAIVANGATGDSNVSDDSGGSEPDTDDLSRYPIDAYGLAIYFPETSGQFAANYAELAFAKDSLWDEMTQDYYHRSQVAPIVADVAKGNLSSLRTWVQSANGNNRPLSRHLASQLRFMLYSENNVDLTVRRDLRDLLVELQKR